MEKIFTSLYRVLVIALLCGILFVQTRLLRSVPPPPPTFGDLRKSSDAEIRKELMLRRQLVVVDGEVGIKGTVDVEVQNTPLYVDIER